MNRSFTALLCSLASRDCESFVKHKKRRVSGAIRMIIVVSLLTPAPDESITDEFDKVKAMKK